MTRPLALADYGRMFSEFARSAFRLETLREYHVGEERDQFAAFLAGEPQDPTLIPDLTDWYELVAQAAAEGRYVGRVRIYDDPPTGYQRWEQYVSHWNTTAGETIGLLARARAADAGIPTNRDWWLFDDAAVVDMDFTPEGRLQVASLITDATDVARYCAWRDLAVHLSASDPGPPA